MAASTPTSSRIKECSGCELRWSRRCTIYQSISVAIESGASSFQLYESDIFMKILSFAKQGPLVSCVISAVGSISNVTLRQPNSSSGTVTYEGMFDIVSLSGLFAPSKVGTSAFNSSGCLKVVLARPGGHVFGGAVAGRIIADIPVQVVFGSFLRSGHQENFVATETTSNNREEEIEADLPLTADCPEQAKK